MVYARKEFLYVAFQNPAGFRVIAACFICKRSESRKRFMRAFSDSARKRIGDEFPVEIWIEYTVYGVVQETVANTCFVNVSWLRVGDVEFLISAVAVGTISKVAVQHKEIVHEQKREFLYIRSSAFSAQEFPPRFKQIFHAYYFFKHTHMQKDLPVSPPDGTSCLLFKNL